MGPHGTVRRLHGAREGRGAGLVRSRSTVGPQSARTLSASCFTVATSAAFCPASASHCSCAAIRSCASAVCSPCSVSARCCTSAICPSRSRSASRSSAASAARSSAARCSACSVSSAAARARPAASCGSAARTCICGLVGRCRHDKGHGHRYADCTDLCRQCGSSRCVAVQLRLSGPECAPARASCCVAKVPAEALLRMRTRARKRSVPFRRPMRRLSRAARTGAAHLPRQSLAVAETAHASHGGQATPRTGLH